VLDKSDPAGEASGRNGGNFELIPENSVGIYEGLARERLLFVRRRYPGLPPPVLRAESERQASLVLGLALRNRDRLRSIIQQEGINCDFSPRGWLYLAHTEREEQALCDEVTLAAQHGQRIELWSRRRIRDEFGFDTPFLGRFIPGDGTFHPFKYVCGLLHSALRYGAQLYTRRRVLAIETQTRGRVRVVTDRGTIHARCVIVATNAFTGRLLPELKAIRPFQSQIILTEHAPDRARGRVVTTEYGPTFFNQPRAGAIAGRAPLLLGGGADRPRRNPASRRRSPTIHARLLRLRDAFYPELSGQPPSAEWIGPMGFTPDQLPAIGFLGPGVVTAAGFNGYGGSYTTAAGQAAAIMALTGKTPDWVPDDVFSPRRLMEVEPPFMRAQDSLWRIAASLCKQLRTVDAQVAEMLAYAPDQPGARVRRTLSSGTERQSLRPELSVAHPERDVDKLRRFARFRQFSREELLELVALMRRWEAPQGSLLFPEGSADGSCFLVVSGTVDVTTSSRGQQRLLTTLPPRQYLRTGQLNRRSATLGDLLGAPRQRAAGDGTGPVRAPLGKSLTVSAEVPGGSERGSHRRVARRGPAPHAHQHRATTHRRPIGISAGHRPAGMAIRADVAPRSQTSARS
jgi:glycine/D-amino acid oxidase-like deaminating enzyme